MTAFFIFLAGMFDGVQTVIKDCPNNSRLRKWIAGIKDEQKRTKYIDWYYGVGGNKRWNPSLPSIPFIGMWYGDAWHTMKFGWIYSWAIAVTILVCEYVVGWWYSPMVFIIAQGIEGDTFRYSYGIWAREYPANTLWELIKNFNPFDNSRRQKTP
ncbi:MAG: hypothetical protein ACYC09_12975 [Bacteroidota bacterium]